MNNTADTKDIYDTKSLANVLGVSQAFVRKLGRTGKIPYSMKGSKMIFVAGDVKKYMEG